MADTWITDITHFLDDDGEIISEPTQAKIFGEYFAAIILMASFPEPEYPPEYTVLCRRRLNRKPCLTTATSTPAGPLRQELVDFKRCLLREPQCYGRVKD